MNDYTPKQLELPFTVTIPLTRGYSTVVDAIDADLKSYNWHTQPSGQTVYAIRNIPTGFKKQTTRTMHRVILERMLGRELVEDEFCDHKDGDGLNNRRSNLRLANRNQNGQNQRRRADNTSGYKGVSYQKRLGKWQASILYDKKIHYLGIFATPELAYEAYCKKAKEVFGEFARLE